jgi:hypothetical protein
MYILHWSTSFPLLLNTCTTVKQQILRLEKQPTHYACEVFLYQAIHTKLIKTIFNKGHVHTAYSLHK